MLKSLQRVLPLEKLAQCKRVQIATKQLQCDECSFFLGSVLWFVSRKQVTIQRSYFRAAEYLLNVQSRSRSPQEILAMFSRVIRFLNRSQPMNSAPTAKIDVIVFPVSAQQLLPSSSVEGRTAVEVLGLT